jgi:hypothetical protein
MPRNWDVNVTHGWKLALAHRVLHLDLDEAFHSTAYGMRSLSQLLDDLGLCLCNHDDHFPSKPDSIPAVRRASSDGGTNIVRYW